MIEPAETDAALVRAAADGNREAFDAIDRRYRDRLVRFLSRQTGDWDRAEELAQQTLVKAFGSIGSLKCGVKLAAWLYRIAMHLLIDETRRTRPILLGDIEPLTQRPGPVETALEKERHENIWLTAQKNLGRDEYAVLWLHYIEGLSDRESAEVLGKSHGAVRVLLHRARRALAKTMQFRDDAE